MAIFIELFLLGVGLSMDAFAVSVCKGLGMRKLNKKQAVIIGLYFGGFQALMPLIGWLLGSQFQKYITSIDHWIAFGLLAFIGGHMLWEVWKGEGEEDENEEAGPLRLGELTLLAIATRIDALEEAFARCHERLNSFIVEPLLQGAGGMRMYDIAFLKRARELCDRYAVLLIFDEVATGFGRTGNRFVADLVLPDILVLGKALTGGYIGHAVTVANEKVFRGFYSDNERHALMHGPTFMGDALACAVALKGIEIFERENYMEKIKKIEEISKREMLGFSDERIKEVRVMGGCTCVEVYDPKTLEGFQQYAYERGVFSRPFLSYMYSMVPYVIEEDELVQIFTVMKDWFRRG